MCLKASRSACSTTEQPIRSSGVAVSADDLRASPDTSLQHLAQLDEAQPIGNITSSGDSDGWVTEDEKARAMGLYVESSMKYDALWVAAQKGTFSSSSIVALRSNLAAGQASTVVAPPPLDATICPLTDQFRSAFVPLAEYLASRFVSAESYNSEYGEVGDRIYHFPADDIVTRYSLHEIKAALAILTAREGGVEFGLSRDKNGAHHLILGQPDSVVLDETITGFDLIMHTHPLRGERGSLPSSGDLFLARAHDPNQRGFVVTQDGWSREYSDHEQDQSD